MRRRVGAVGVALLVAGLVLLGQARSAEAAIIVAEGFEGSALPAGWTADDAESGGGLDSWGPTTVRAATGSWSVWCAQNGTNSATNQSNPLLRRYDALMDANLVRSTGALTRYRSVQLQFSFWAETDPFDGRERLTLWSWDGVQWRLVWIQGTANSSGWQVATAPLPLNTTAISFNFHSGSGLPIEEGVYLDDVRVEGERAGEPWWPLSPLGIVGIAGGAALGGTLLVYVLKWRRRRSGAPPQAPS